MGEIFAKSVLGNDSGCVCGGGVYWDVLVYELCCIKC